MKFPYSDKTLIEEATDQLLKTTNIFQSHLLGGNEYTHCEHLRGMLSVPIGSTVLDIGSGVGGVADRMPGLDFTLLNLSDYQLHKSNPKHGRIQADAHELPFARNSFDAALLLYVLGHCDTDVVLAEAERVARVVLVGDIIADDRQWWEDNLHYTPPRLETLMDHGTTMALFWSDGGLFENTFPGAWARTAAKTAIMRVA